MANQLEIGSEVGGYRLTGSLGQGGMGAVFTAERTSDGQQVAFKVMSGSLGGSPEFRRRFAREAKYARSVDHPNIVRVLDSGDEDGVLWLAMDLVRGRDLAAIVAQEGGLKPSRAVRILGQAADALDAVHAAGLLHRDVKAANVLVQQRDGEERAFLTDFGLGKAPSTDSQALTAAGHFVGTGDYCAPEQILARDDVDHRVDVYSLGCLLFECLVGEPPFRRERQPDVLRAHLDELPPRPSERVESLPGEIDEPLAVALAKDPKDRYPSCRAFIDAVEAALASAPTAREPSTSDQDEIGESGLRLEVVRGGNVGTMIEVANELLIGREAPGAGRLADDLELSRRHARIWRDDERGWTIEDLGSTNGSFVNGQRIATPQQLAAQDMVDMGTTTLRVVAVRSEAPATTQPPASSVPTPPASRVVSPAEREAATQSSAEREAATQSPAEGEAATQSSAERKLAPEPPPLSIRLEVEGAEARIIFDEDAEPVRLSFEDGAWRLASPAEPE